MNAVIFRADGSIALFLSVPRLQHVTFHLFVDTWAHNPRISCSQHRIPMLWHVENAALSKNQDSQFRSWEEKSISRNTCQGWAVSSFLFSIRALLRLTQNGKALGWCSELCTTENPEGIGTKEGRIMSTPSVSRWTASPGYGRRVPTQKSQNSWRNMQNISLNGRNWNLVESQNNLVFFWQSLLRVGRYLCSFCPKAICL